MCKLPKTQQVKEKHFYFKSIIIVPPTVYDIAWNGLYRWFAILIDWQSSEGFSGEP